MNYHNATIRKQDFHKKKQKNMKFESELSIAWKGTFYKNCEKRKILWERSDFRGSGNTGSIGEENLTELGCSCCFMGLTNL